MVGTVRFELTTSGSPSEVTDISASVIWYWLRILASAKDLQDVGNGLEPMTKQERKF